MWTKITYPPDHLFLRNKLFRDTGTKQAAKAIFRKSNPQPRHVSPLSHLFLFGFKLTPHFDRSGYKSRAAAICRAWQRSRMTIDGVLYSLVRVSSEVTRVSVWQMVLLKDDDYRSSVNLLALCTPRMDLRPRVTQGQWMDWLRTPCIVA